MSDSVYFTKAFWKGAAERAIKTVGQAAAAFVTADVAGILDLDGVQLLSVAGLAGLVSLFQSVGNADFVAGETTARPYSSPL